MDYVVRSGDTLSRIAERNGTSVSNLMSLNPNIKQANLISVGQRIILSKAVTTYLVKSGDSLSKIARKYGTSVSDIMAINPSIKKANLISVGQKILIPTKPTGRKVTRRRKPVAYSRNTFSGGVRPTMGRMVPQVNVVAEWLYGDYDITDSDYLIVEKPPAAKKKSKPGKTAGINPAPWMKVAFVESDKNVKEVRGSKSNPRVMEYIKASGMAWAKDDSGGTNAWCASFVSWVLKQSGYPMYHDHAMRAVNYMKYGTKLAEPVYGAICVKYRNNSKNTALGHVAFIVGQSKDGKKYYMLGGNQGDKVCVMEYPKDVWVSFVVPTGYDTSNASLPIYTGAFVKSGRET